MFLKAFMRYCVLQTGQSYFRGKWKWPGRFYILINRDCFIPLLYVYLFFNVECSMCRICCQIVNIKNPQIIQRTLLIFKSFFSFQNLVEQFLVKLTTHSDVNLRFLSFRLDFNEHYKKKEPRLRSTLSVKYTRRRIAPGRTNTDFT